MVVVVVVRIGIRVGVAGTTSGGGRHSGRRMKC